MKGIELLLQRAVQTAVQPSERVCRVASMFGLGIDRQRTVQIVPPTSLTLAAGRVIFLTGASGGGKTTLLRMIDEALADRTDARAIRFDELHCSDDRPLVETLGQTLEQSVRYLSLAGLNDAFVMLRRPGELSDGQRYRYRLAQAIEKAEASGAEQLCVLLADEFAATLDRTTASVIARNAQRWVRRGSGDGGARICLVVATSHDDLLEALEPDTLIVQEPGAAITVLQRDDNETH